jgi:hypothetical protein
MVSEPERDERVSRLVSKLKSPNNVGIILAVVLFVIIAVSLF